MFEDSICLLCRNFFTANLDFSRKMTDNVGNNILEVPYVM